MHLDSQVINNLFNDISTTVKQIYLTYYNHTEAKNRPLIDALVAVNRMETYIKEGIDWRGRLDLLEKGLLTSREEYGFPVFSPIR